MDVGEDPMVCVEVDRISSVTKVGTKDTDAERFGSFVFLILLGLHRYGDAYLAGRNGDLAINRCEITIPGRGGAIGVMLCIGDRKPHECNVLVPGSDFPINQHLCVEDGVLTLMDGLHRLAEPYLRVDDIGQDDPRGLEDTAFPKESSVLGSAQAQDHRFVFGLIDLVLKDIDDDFPCCDSGGKRQRTRLERIVSNA